MATKREVAIAWLDRRIRALELECEEPSSEKMARAGVSYSKRGKIIDQAAEKRKQVAVELDALRYARSVVDKHG